MKNSGPFGVADVTFSDTLPDGFPVNGVFASAGVNCSSAGQAVICDLGGLVVGGQAQIVVSSSAPATTLTADTTALVTSSSPDSNPANNSVGVTVQVK